METRRIRELAALLTLVGEGVLLVNLLTHGALLRSAEAHYARLLERRRREAERQRLTRHVLFDAEMACRDAARDQEA